MTDHVSSDDILPQILIHVADGRELGRLTEVSKQWKKVIETNDKLWDRQIENFNDKIKYGIKIKKPNQSITSRQFFINMYQSKLNARLKSQNERKKQIEYERWVPFFSVSSKIIEILTFLGLLAFFVLLSLKLAPSLLISWPLVFLPLFIILALNAFYLSKFEVFHYGYHDNMEIGEDFWFHGGFSDSDPEHTPIVNILTVFTNNSLGRSVTWATFLSVSLEIILLCLYLSTNSLPLFSIFIIPYIATFIFTASLCLCCCATATGSDDDDDDTAITTFVTMGVALSSMFCALVFGIFFILVHIKLNDPSKFSWLMTFIVLWIGKFIVVLILLVSCLWSWGTRKLFVSHLITVFTVYVPSSIIFEVFLALKLDGAIGWDWRIVFVPLYLASSFTLVSVGMSYWIGSDCTKFRSSHYGDVSII